jgi:chlorophyll/bacteriochlorophyll a synthase
MLSLALPKVSAVAELLKPITWFPPMWAFACGAVASGTSADGRLGLVAGGVLLAGPLVCATSQAVNDWFDREVDAINEPHRPIPSGRMPGRSGLYVAIAWTLLSLAAAWALGPWVLAAAALGLALAWAYSAPPLRLKQNGWWGNAACGVCYEGLAWITGAAVMAGGAPSLSSLMLAALYARHHDAQRFQVDRRRHAHGHRLIAGAARAATGGASRMLGDGAAAGGRDRPAR